MALPGTRRPALPSACSSRPAPQELSRGPGPSHGARTGLPAGLTSYSPRLGGGCGREGGTEGRGRLPLPRGAGPPSRAPPQGRMGPGRAGPASRLPRRSGGVPRPARCLAAAPEPLPRGLEGAMAFLGFPAAGRRWSRATRGAGPGLGPCVCAVKAEESGGCGGKPFIGMRFAHPDVLVVLL